MTDENLNEETVAPVPADPYARVVGNEDTVGSEGSVDNELSKLRKAYRPVEGAKVEFNVHPAGVSIVANKEGWESLAAWCQIMAHPEMGEYSSPYELTDDVFPSEMFDDNRAILAFWGIEETDEAWLQDVYFHRSPVIGEDLWHGDPKSGNSPRTRVATCQAMDRYKWVIGLERLDVDADLGAVLFEGVGANGVRTVVYTAETPEGWVGVEYGEENKATGYGFSRPAPWDEDLSEVEVVTAYKGAE